MRSVPSDVSLNCSDGLPLTFLSPWEHYFLKLGRVTTHSAAQVLKNLKSLNPFPACLRSPVDLGVDPPLPSPQLRVGGPSPSNGGQ